MTAPETLYPVGTTVYVWGEHHEVLKHRDDPLGVELLLARPKSEGKRRWVRWVRARAVYNHRRNRGLE